MPEYDYDLFTIGAGSGGVRASRVAAAHGAKVAVAEEYRVGGTCVIRGCVPKKMLVYGAHFAEDLEDARQFGWHIENATFDWISLRDTVLADVDRLNGIYTGTLENHGVEIFHERATLIGPHDIRLASGRTVTAKNILICTGARPHVPQFPGCEHGITSNEAFHLDALPSRVLIAGAGYIANEFAGIFHQFGCEVTIINRSDQLLRSYDQSLRDRQDRAPGQHEPPAAEPIDVTADVEAGEGHDELPEASGQNEFSARPAQLLGHGDHERADRVVLRAHRDELRDEPGNDQPMAIKDPRISLHRHLCADPSRRSCRPSLLHPTVVVADHPAADRPVANDPRGL